MRYWIYKCNVEGGPAGYWGDWRTMVFHRKAASEWGGHYSTGSAEVALALNGRVGVGDVVAAFQTNEHVVVGFCRIDKITGPDGSKKLWLRPIEYLDPPLALHEAKKGTILEDSNAVNGPVMLRELERAEMEELVRLAGAPPRVLKGEAAKAGYKPIVP